MFFNPSFSATDLSVQPKIDASYIFMEYLATRLASANSFEGKKSAMELKTLLNYRTVEVEKYKK